MPRGITTGSTVRRRRPTLARRPAADSRGRTGRAHSSCLKLTVFRWLSIRRRSRMSTLAKLSRSRHNRSRLACRCAVGSGAEATTANSSSMWRVPSTSPSISERMASSSLEWTGRPCCCTSPAFGGECCTRKELRANPEVARACAQPRNGRFSKPAVPRFLTSSAGLAPLAGPGAARLDPQRAPP
jgi:hypothetical protein